jgi:hypothetical protein
MALWKNMSVDSLARASSEKENHARFASILETNTTPTAEASQLITTT